MKFWIAGAVAALSLAATTTPALAHSECTGTVSRLYVDNNGYIWIDMAGGGSVEIYAANPNKITYYSALLSAKMGNKTVTFRYVKDSTTCSAVNADLMALWLN